MGTILYSMSVIQSTKTLLHHCLHQLLLTHVSTQSTQTSLDHRRHPKATPTYQHPSITSLVGQRQCQQQTSQQIQCHKHLCVLGYPDLEFHQLSQQIGAVNLNLTFGSNLCSYLAQKEQKRTAYHPIANGIVERFHRQLKGALKATTDPINWVDMLPTILLGIHTSLKHNLKGSIVELVYGTTLSLPGDFFQSTNIQLDPTTYVTELKKAMQQLQPPKVWQQIPRKVYISTDLRTCTHVIVCHDAIKKAL